ncbi:deoxyribonuclease YjjV [bacteria symbiont BFo2 of Frankliniella occidentalis]|nr:deoxyribonuclease YjjV [bacteria symbiont BFo2 of Frankliniella occidentalis]KYP87251.1 deoxyribonuclease YjjV [bacteria symbiont BFo2 of Frankliniella occidentalis]KYP95235.1 deoxyribonuclease YjjV [bacteria symbiont BFo2 of Frankliniella occidentalis]
MPYIDTHCHFNFPVFAQDLTQSLNLIRQAQLQAIVTPATQVADFDSILRLAGSIPEIFPALGLHPLWTAQHHDQDLRRLRQLLDNHDEVIAIGEIGVDFFTDELVALAPRQWEILSLQLRLAKEYNLPVILHSRKSHDPLSKVLKDAALPATGVIHGFTGSYQQAKRFIDLGFYLGVGGSISYPRANKTREALARVPLEQLVLETDAPDMPLNGYQGEINRPERVVTVCQILAELRGESVEKIRDCAWQNSLRLFPKLSTVLS